MENVVVNPGSEVNNGGPAYSGTGIKPQKNHSEFENSKNEPKDYRKFSPGQAIQPMTVFNLYEIIRMGICRWPVL
jgi:hypothetical protein